MISFKRYTIIFLVSLLSQAALAQNGNGLLSGKLQDAQGAPLAFANIILLKASDSALVSGTVANGEGAFTIATPVAGTYFLKFTSIGYKARTTATFQVSGPAYNKDFGSISLQEDLKMLEAVVVETLHPKVITEADKMIVSVEGTALAAGSSVMEVLAKSPGIWIDQDGNIQLNGKGGVKVMLDGRPTYFSAKELQNLLQGMPAENIREIEIISNPSARQDAEGSAGILNIKLKKNRLQGVNGSVYANYAYNRLHTYSGGASINYKKAAWNSSLNLDVAERNSFSQIRMEREFNQEGDYTRFKQRSYEVRKNRTPSLKLDSDYELSAGHTIGVSLSLAQWENPKDFNAQMQLLRSEVQENLSVDMNTRTSESKKSGMLNLHYIAELDTLGSKLTADLDYVHLSTKNVSSFRNAFEYAIHNNMNVQNLETENPSAYRIYAGRLDLTLPIGKSKVEAGLKGSYVESDNNLQFFSLEDARKLPVDSMSNHFLYRENILAAYGTFSTSLGEKWNLQAGLRAEQTFSEGESLSTGELTKRKYLDLFPSIFVQQIISPSYQLSYNYSRRINRPPYEALNPFLIYFDPYTTLQGNPYLRPEYAHSFEVTQTFKQAYNLVLGYSSSKDFFVEIPLQDAETKTTVLVKQNMERFRNFRATLVAPIEVMPKWSIFNNVMLAYQSFETEVNNQREFNKGLFFLAQLNNTVKLPLGIITEFSGIYQGPLAYGLFQVDSRWWLNAAVKKAFLNEKLDVSINVTDLLDSFRESGRADVGLNRNYFEQFRGMQSIKLNLRYNFSKGEKFRSKSRNRQFEELERVGE